MLMDKMNVLKASARAPAEQQDRMPRVRRTLFAVRTLRCFMRSLLHMRSLLQEQQQAKAHADLFVAGGSATFLKMVACHPSGWVGREPADQRYVSSWVKRMLKAMVFRRSNFDRGRSSSWERIIALFWDGARRYRGGTGVHESIWAHSCVDRPFARDLIGSGRIAAQVRQPGPLRAIVAALLGVVVVRTSSPLARGV